MNGARMNIDQTQDAIIEEFNLFDQWFDKYEYLIDLGKNLPVIDDAFKTDDNLIRGCQSRVWLHAEMDAGRVHFTADSDAVITRGIIALLIRVLAGQKPEDIAAAQLYFIDAIGLREHLSSTRANGLVNMVSTLQSIGRDFSRAH